MNGLHVLRTTDFAESVALAATVQRASEIRYKDLEHLANLITDKLVKAWNDGQKKGKEKK